jgi:hypothetical protein
MTAQVDILRLKKELETLLSEQPEEFEKMIGDLKAEKKEEITPEFIAIMEKNFERFDETFKALA